MNKPYVFALTGAIIGSAFYLGTDFQIATVKIDNPSGTWLYLSSPVNRYIAPGSIGWVVSVDPRTSNLELRVVNAPVGGVASAITGGPVVVDLYSDDMPDVTGVDYTLLPAIQNLNVNLAATNALLTTLNTNIIALTAAVVATAPPDILSAFASFTTSAVIGVSTTSDIVAAPGAGFKHRIYRADAFGRYLNTGKITLFVVSPISVFGLMGLAPAGGGDHIAGSSQGIDGVANQPIQVTHISDVASQTFTISVWYTVEAV